MIRSTRAAVAMLIALPIVVLAVHALEFNVPDFNDPCVGWGGAPVTDTSCTTWGVRDDTKTQAVLLAVVVPAFLIVAAILGVWGVAGSHRTLAVIGAGLMILGTIPLALSLWPLPLLTGGGFLCLGLRA